MSKTTIPTGGITADAINATLIADDAISEEHIDATVITGSTALAATPADTDELIISDAGTLKRIDFSHIKANSTPAFCATMSADQTGGNNDMVKIAYNTEVFDTNSAYDHSSNYRFTVPSGAAGKYFFSAMTNIHSSGTNPARSQTNSIYVNNSSIVRSQLFSASGVGSIFEYNQDNICHCTLLHDLDVDDYVEVFAKRYSDNSENIKAKTAFSRFMGFKLA
jgi:hypothetical protein